MSDPKSKLPDLQELATMTSKLFNDIKNSVGQIVHDYKEKRAQQETTTADISPRKDVPVPPREDVPVPPREDVPVPPREDVPVPPREDVPVPREDVPVPPREKIQVPPKEDIQIPQKASPNKKIIDNDK